MLDKNPKMKRTGNKSGALVSRADLPDVSRNRSIPTEVKLQLVSRASGRCQFYGCNDFLFTHHVTKAGGYFGNYAHIRAFSPSGPRAESGHISSATVHALENLMLLCPRCHKLVDTDVAQFPIEKLREWKRQHEEHNKYMLDLPRDNAAAMLEVWTNVASPPVVRSSAEMFAALLPLYPSREHSYQIDFAGKNLSDTTTVLAAVDEIDSKVTSLF